jgi:hypothetical protein
MLRRFAFAVVATAALSVYSTNAKAQALQSQIHSLRTDSDDDGIGLSPYTMLYWFRALQDYGSGDYATRSGESDYRVLSFIPDVPSIGWARLLRRPASPSINSADDPSLPGNAQFFNPVILTRSFETPSNQITDWRPQPSSPSPGKSEDDSQPSPDAIRQLFVTPSLPGAEAWTNSDGPDEGSGDAPGPLVSALALTVDAPSVAVIASPEPATLWLVATGATVVIGVGKRRRKAAA